MLGANRKPTIAAKAMRGHHVAGAVSGSVSITNAKNSSGDEPSVSLSAVRYCDGSEVARIVTSATAMKVATRSNRRSLRTMRRPPTSTTGSNGRLPPTHHVAGWSRSSAVSATPSAAGLNRCFLPMARMNLDEIAQRQASTIAPIPLRSMAAMGSRMSARIKAVM